MQAVVQRRSLPRFLLIFLILIGGLVAASWVLSRSHSTQAAAQADVNLPDAVYIPTNSTDRIIESLQSQLRAAPEDWQGYSQLGLAYLQKAREVGNPSYYQKAEDVLKKALSLQPDDYTSTSAMGALELSRHQFHSGLEWGERALKINPDHAYAYGVVADAQVELGLYPEAVQTLQEMVDLRPDMSSFTRISYIRELHGDIQGAIEMMRAAVDSGGPNAENTMWARTQLGNLYFNSGNLKQAEAEYQAALQGLPGYVYALAGLGRVRAAQGQMDEAIALLTQASDTIPVPEFIITLGDLYQVTGQTAAAQKEYALLGVIEKLYQANGVDMDMEIALFNADHNIQIASTVEQARQAYERRSSTYGADVLAWALYKSGDYTEAQKYSSLALRLGAKDSLKLFHAGMIEYRLGNKTQARETLDQALKINPYFSLLYAGEAERTLDELIGDQRSGIGE